MPGHVWSVPVDSVCKFVETTSPEAGALLLWSTWTVDALYYLTDIDHQVFSGAMGSLLERHDRQVVDIAHARWASGGAITAIDLCAAVLGRLHCGITGPRECDLEELLRPARIARLPLGAQAWANTVQSDPDYAVIKNARDPLTHRRVKRLLKLSLPRALLDRTVLGTLNPVTVPDLVATCLRVSARQVDAFLLGVPHW